MQAFRLGHRVLRQRSIIVIGKKCLLNNGEQQSVDTCTSVMKMSLYTAHPLRKSSPLGTQTFITSDPRVQKQTPWTTSMRCRSRSDTTSESLSEADIKKAVESLTDQFMEARELLDDARESFGTVYFSDDVQEAQTAVQETLKFYENFLSQLSTDQKQQVLRNIGLKMEELKAQEQALKEELHE